MKNEYETARRRVHDLRDAILRREESITRTRESIKDTQNEKKKYAEQLAVAEAAITRMEEDARNCKECNEKVHAWENWSILSKEKKEFGQHAFTLGSDFRRSISGRRCPIHRCDDPI